MVKGHMAYGQGTDLGVRFVTLLWLLYDLGPIPLPLSSSVSLFRMDMWLPVDLRDWIWQLGYPFHSYVASFVKWFKICLWKVLYCGSAVKVNTSPHWLHWALCQALNDFRTKLLSLHVSSCYFLPACGGNVTWNPRVMLGAFAPALLYHRFCTIAIGRE